MLFAGLSDRPAYEIVEPGWYNFTIESRADLHPDGEQLLTSGGVPYLKLRCRDKKSGVTLIHCLFLDPEKPGKVFYFLTAIGHEVEGEVTFSPEIFEGKSFRGKVEVADGRNRIVLVNPVTSEQAATMIPTDYPKPDPAGQPMDPAGGEDETDDQEEDVPF